MRFQVPAADCKTKKKTKNEKVRPPPPPPKKKKKEAAGGKGGVWGWGGEVCGGGEKGERGREREGGGGEGGGGGEERHGGGGGGGGGREEGQTNTLHATVSWQQANKTRHSHSQRHETPQFTGRPSQRVNHLSAGVARSCGSLPVVMDTQAKASGSFKKSGALCLSCSHHLKSHSHFRQVRMSCQITDSVDDHFDGYL